MSSTIRTIRVAGAVLAAMLMAPWPSSAQDISGCRAIADDKERLACFDRAAAAPAARTTPPAAASPAAGFGLGEPPATKPEDFGRASLPIAPPPPGPKDEPAPITEITAKIVRIIDPYGKPKFVLDNNQVWASVSYVRITPRATGENSATIESSLVGYLMRLNDSQVEFNVKRLE
jgi:hypothetical protein